MSTENEIAVAQQLARHEETLHSHRKWIGRVMKMVENLGSEIVELKEILHGDGKNVNGVISDLRDVSRIATWIRRLAWATGAQTIVIIGGILMLVVKLLSGDG